MSVSLAKYGAVFCTVLPPFRLPEAEGCVCSLGQQVPDEEGNDGTLADHPTPEPGWVRMGEPVAGGGRALSFALSEHLGTLPPAHQLAHTII